MWERPGSAESLASIGIMRFEAPRIWRDWARSGWVLGTSRQCPNVGVGTAAIGSRS